MRVALDSLTGLGSQADCDNAGSGIWFDPTTSYIGGCYNVPPNGSGGVSKAGSNPTLQSVLPLTPAQQAAFNAGVPSTTSRTYTPATTAPSQGAAIGSSNSGISPLLLLAVLGAGAAYLMVHH